MCDLEAIGAQSTFSIIRSAAALARMWPTLLKQRQARFQKVFFYYCELKRLYHCEHCYPALIRSPSYLHSPLCRTMNAPAERLLSIEVGKRFPLDGIDVRSIAAANGPEGLIALSGRQGLWLASPEDSVGERCLTRAITKDAAGKWIDLGSVSWCVCASCAFACAPFALFKCLHGL